MADFDRNGVHISGKASATNPFEFPPEVGTCTTSGLFIKTTTCISGMVKYKTTLKVPATAEYTFTASGLDVPASTDSLLNINGQVIFNGFGNASGKITLVKDVEYPLEFTVRLNSEASRAYSITISSRVAFNFEGTFKLQDFQPTLFGAYISSDPFDPNRKNTSEIASFNELTVANIRRAVNAIIDFPDNKLSVIDRARIKGKLEVAIKDNLISIKGLPFELWFRQRDLQDGRLWQRRNDGSGTVSSPVKMTIPSGVISLTKGKLDPITALGIDSFEIGQTVVNTQPGIANIPGISTFVTNYEPIKPTTPGGFKLAYFLRNTYNSDGAVDVPANSFGIYGNQTQLPLDVAGVKLNGLANLGTVASPALIVTNAQFNRLSYAIPDVKVDNLTFTAGSVGSAKPLTVNYFPPQGRNPKSYVVLGGAVMKPSGTVVKSDLKANFGGLGSDGLRIFPAKDNIPASFTFSFGVAETFLAGTQAIKTADGLGGLKLIYDPKTKAYNFQGNAVLDFNPTTPHTPTDLAFTGSKLKVSATAPLGVTGFPANRLDGSTLNFFLDESASINGFNFAPRTGGAPFNPLRVTITSSGTTTTDTINGAFTMKLDGGNLFGVMEPTGFNGSKVPATGVRLDFTPVAGQPSGYALAGVLLDQAGKTTLTDILSVKFATATYQGGVLVLGTAGAEPAVVEAKNGKLTKAEVKGTISTVIGDVTFQNFTTTYNFAATPGYWNFVGPGTYFGKSFNVGTATAGSMQLRIGGDLKKGEQLVATSKPPADLPASFALPKTVEVAGLSFDVSTMQQDAPVVDAGSSKTYSLNSPNFVVKVGNTTLSLVLSMKVKVSAAPIGAEIVSFSATGKQGSAFSIGNATFQIETVTVEYNFAEKALKISGKAKFTFKAAKANVDMTVTLGTVAAPGLVIKDGAIETLQVTVDGSFDILKLNAKAIGLTIEYKKENTEFAIYGTLSLSTAAQGGVQVLKDVAVTLGNKEKPGIKIVDGSLESLDITINGEINLFKLTATPKDLHIAYSAEENQLQIDGELSITLATGLTLTAGLPGDGLLIDTETGKVQVKGLSLKAEGDITFGVLKIKGLHVEYEEADNGDVTIGAGAEIELPSGLAVGGSFKIINGKLDEIAISFEKNPGILVANGLVNIYRLEVSVKGLSDLNNFEFKGTVKATVGPLVKFAGQAYALADVTGSITITPRSLTLEGDVQLVGGLFGNGKFKGVLLWNPAPGDPNQVPRVTFDAEINLYPGDIIRGKMSAYADIKGNVDFSAQMGVYVPSGIPLVGGASLGQLSVELRVRPAEEPSASYAKFAFSDIAITPFRIPTFHGSVRVAFDSNVDYNFGARFYIPLPWPLPNIDFSLDIGGSFQLRDSENPSIEILAASALSGTPNGEILYAAMSPIPDGTMIDLYADHDNLGNDGLLIASGLAYRDGTQTFLWENMASFANPGEPVYVYAVINDQQHPKVHSDYSPRFNVAPGFIPTIVNPASLSFMAGDIATFSATLGNAIVIGDPRRNANPDSEVEVILNVGSGTIDLSHAPDNVRYSGEGTGRMILRGSALDLTAALEGLHYVQRVATDVSDTLEITVRNLPLENLAGGTRATVILNPNPVNISLAASQHDDLPTEITAGKTEETPLSDVQIGSLNSDHLAGATVKINNFEPGKDLLGLSLDDEFVSGIDATFDQGTGVLTLTGFDWIDDYEHALRSVTFSTTSMTAGKSLTVSLADDNGDRGSLNVPLQVIAQHPAPKLNLTTLGKTYLSSSGAVKLDAESSLEVAGSSAIQSITVEFIEDSYVAGDDVLLFTGTTIQGSFNAQTGKLVLTGNGSLNQWIAALHEVNYQSLAATFQAGNRYLLITVQDNGPENNVDTEFFAIRKKLVNDVHVGPTLSLAITNLTLPANEDLIPLANDLSLNADHARIFGATVAITKNYVSGEDVLIVSSLWDGMDAKFDPATGMLTITGIATEFEYEDALRSVSFVDSAGYRTPGQIEITFSVFDGLASSADKILTVNIEAAPYISSDVDNVMVYSDGRATQPIGLNLSIQHVGTLGGAIVSISSGYSANEEVLVFSNQNGITSSYDGTIGVLTLSGTASAAAYEAALESIQYRNARFNPVAGERIVSFQVFNGTSLSNVSQALISVEPDIVPPQVSLGATTAFTEDGAPVAIAPNFTLTPMDATTPFLSAPETLFGAEVDIVNYVPGEDVLQFTPTDKIAGEFNLVEGRIYLTGEASFDEYEAAIRGILYANTSDVPTTTTRQISIRLLDSGENGLANQAISTQVVIGVADPVGLVAGVADDIHVMQNDEPVTLGLDDLAFVSTEPITDGFELRFTVTELPGDTLGRIVLADGTAIQLNTPYAIGDLAGLKFEPEIGGMGTGKFTYSVALSDLDTGNMDSGNFTDTVMIAVDGIATTNASQAFVAQAYRDLLNQNPDQATLTNLANQLDQKLERVDRATNGFSNEALARRSLLIDLTSSDTYRNTFIDGLFQTYLGRPATASELAASRAELAAGTTTDDARLGLLASSEYFQLHDDSGFSSYIPAVYQDLLSREPTSRELSGWVADLQFGTSPLTFVTEIGGWSNLGRSDQRMVLEDLLHRDFEFSDTFEFDFSSRDALTLSILASDEYFVRSSAPSTTTQVRTRETSDFPSVGKLGDIVGDKAGGTLIAPQYALVAAHSVVGLPPGQLTFTIGGVKHRIADVIIHPDYDPESVGLEGANDIAILKLDEAVAGIAPSLLSGRAPKLGESLLLVGFGEHDGSAYGIKRVGSTPPVDEVGATLFRWTHDNPVQNDSDAGDSGSPVFATIGGVNTIVGLVSGGTSTFTGLGGVATNTRVDGYLAWIRSIVPSVTALDVADPPSLQLESTRLYIDENAGPQTVGLQTSGDDSVTFNVTTDNPAMFSRLLVDYGTRTVGDLVFETALNQRGTSKIIVTAFDRDGSFTETITVTVEERNDPPTIDPIPPHVLNINPGPQTISFTGISAGLGETGNVNIAIVDVEPISFFSSVSITRPSSNGSGESPASMGMLSFTPNAGVEGTAFITLEVRDSGDDGRMNTADDQTTIQNIPIITTSNIAPTLDAIPNQRILVGSEGTVVELSGIGDGSGGTQSLRITAMSANRGIVSALPVLYDPEETPTTAQLRLAPIALGTTEISVQITDWGTDGIFDTLDDRSLARKFQVAVVQSLNNWNNPVEPLDVNSDNFITALDALNCVNDLNQNGSRLLPPRQTPRSPYIDVNNDGSSTPLDVLLIVNYINSRAGSGLGESESVQPHATPDEAVRFDALQLAFDDMLARTDFALENEPDTWVDVFQTPFTSPTDPDDVSAISSQRTAFSEPLYSRRTGMLSKRSSSPWSSQSIDTALDELLNEREVLFPRVT